MNVLIVHQNFPGQFPHIADALVARGDKVAAIGGPTAKGRPGVDLRRWENKRSSTPGIFDAATRAEADLIRAEAAVRTASALRRDGFKPDMIIGHPGWGETLHLRDIFPTAKLVLFGEYYYRQYGGDVNFDLEFDAPSLEGAMRTNGKNATQALAYTMADMIVCPTEFQASTFPRIFKSLIRVQHEGIDLKKSRRKPDAQVKLPNGRVIDAKIPVITFINRNFERLRGFHIFMRALPAIMKASPEVEVIAIGADGVGYGGPLPAGQTWRSKMLAEVGHEIDQSRLHFTGRVSHDEMINILSISRAHAYLTYPFVLSWSLLEAMACECLIVGSDTPPVRDAIINGQSGLLTPFFDVDAWSATLTHALSDQADRRSITQKAKRAVEARFDNAVGVPAWLSLLDLI